jgi:alpha-beta hydrolase superfamily lysophospholipase
MGSHDEGFITSSLNSNDGLRLFWQSDTPATPRAHVAIIHGFGDHSGRYATLRDALVNAGYATHALDYRGHGRADGQRGHVDRFSQYIDDVERFWDHVRDHAGGLPTMLFGHSHGALISILFALLVGKGASAPTSLILSSPFLALAFEPPLLKVLGAQLVGKVWPRAPFNSGLKIHELTRDPQVQESTRRDPLYHASLTPRWFDEVRKAQAEAQARAGEITLPVMVFGGALDPIASVPAMRTFFERVGSTDKKYKEYPGMLHETFNELGRDEVERDVANWISLHV